jgi:hypothetical protein
MPAEDRSRSRGRDEAHATGNGTVAPPGASAGVFDLEAFAKALTPYLKTAIKEEVGDKLDSIGKRLDKVESRVDKIEALEPRVQELERRIAEAPHVLRGASASSGDFVPTFEEIKGFCSWEERQEKGLTRAMATRLVELMRSKLPNELKDHFKEVQLRGIMNYKVQVKCAPEFTREIRGCLADILKANDDLKVNGVQPYVIAERPLQERLRLQKFGRLVEVVKGMAKDLVGTTIQMDARSCSIYVQVEGADRPHLVAEILQAGQPNIHEENCTKCLKCEKSALLDGIQR